MIKRRHVLEWMILLAANAFAVLWILTSLSSHVALYYHLDDGHTDELILAYHCEAATRAVLVSWSVALTALGLIRSGVPLRRLLARPGYVVCFAVTLEAFVWLGLIILGFGFRIFYRLPSFWGEDIRALTLRESSTTAYLIMIWWTLLAFSRRWRPSRGWIDRAGRIIGVIWIVSIVLHLAVDYGFDVENDHRTMARQPAPSR